LVQRFALVHQQQAGLGQGLLLAVGQGFAAAEGGGIQYQHGWLDAQHFLPWRLPELPQQFRRVAQAGGFDQQTVWLCLTQQARQADLERHAVDAAQAAAGDLRQTDTVCFCRQQRGVQADLAELVDQYGPAFVGGLLIEQMADQAGFAGAERAADEMGRDMFEHGGYGAHFALGLKGAGGSC